MTPLLRPGRARIPGCVVWVAAGLLATGSAAAQGADEFERPPIEYSARTPQDAVSALVGRLATGKASLPRASERETVRWLLRELGIPECSQVLVFSQTSLQNDRIRPGHPRALYFNDDVYVGWVPGGLAEISPVEPQLGPTFYAFDPRPDPASGVSGPDPAVRFRRDTDCLRCHGTFVRDIPAVFARSVGVDAEGRPTGTLGGRLVDPTTPFSERWGGWYVTGTHGSARHRGNGVPADGRELTPEERDRGANVTDLSARVDLTGYLAPGSDIVALMVLEHQLAVHNGITRAGHHVRRMLHYQQGVQRGLGEAVTQDPVYESTRRAVASTAQDLLDVLLMVGEAPLPDGGIQGGPAFRMAYESRGPTTSKGLSLRQLDLQSHLYRYRCSPLIHGQAFRALPPSLRTAVLQRLRGVLTSLDADPRYGHLRPGERRMIREILRETHPEYAAVDP